MDNRRLIEEFAYVLNGNISNGSKGVVDEVSAGIRLIGITIEETAKKRIAQGADLSLLYPEDGTSAVPDGSALVKNAPHGDNAKRFIDFTVSVDAQRMVVDQFMRRTVRTDLALDSDQDLSSMNIIDFDLKKAAIEQEEVISIWSEYMDQEE
jgi:iron(III) transport system substrate-binding protein